MDWSLILCLSPILLMIVLSLFNVVWDDLNPYIASYKVFNTKTESDVKLTYKQWRDFASIKPEAFCIKNICLYEVHDGQFEKLYTNIHFNFVDYVRFVFAYTRMKNKEKKVKANQKERNDMAAFINRMQNNIKEYRNKIDAECHAAKQQLSKVASNMLDNQKEVTTRKCLCYKGTHPPAENANMKTGDLYMSADGKEMYVVDANQNLQKWDASTLLTYISKYGMDASEAFDFVTSPVSELYVKPKDEIRYKYLGNGLTKMIPQMQAGDIYYNPVLKKYMVMEATGEMNYFTTDDFVDRFGGINSCQNV